MCENRKLVPYEMAHRTITSYLPAATKLWPRLCFYSCLWFCPQGGLLQCMLGYCYPHKKEAPPRKQTPPAKETSQEGDTPLTKETPLQTHTQGGNWGGSGPGPHPMGKLRGIRSRPTPKGEIEGDQIQAHTQGGNWGGSDPGPHPRGNWVDQIQAHTQWGNWGVSDPGPHPRGKLRGIRSRPPPSIWSMSSQYTSYWNAFLFLIFLEDILLWDHYYPCLGRLVMSALGFKARVITSLVCFIGCTWWIPEIHLWCNTGLLTSW